LLCKVSNLQHKVNALLGKVAESDLQIRHDRPAH